MARFGRDFVRAATQPAYLGGLFTAAQDIGSLPARAAAAQQQQLEKQQQEQKLEQQRQYQAGLLSLGASGEFDPEMLQGALGGAAELGISPITAAQSIQTGQSFVKPRLTVEQKQKLLENFTVESVAEYERTGNTAVFSRRTTPPKYNFETKQVVDPVSGKTNLVRFTYDENSANPSVPVFENVIGVAPSKDGANGANGAGGAKGKQTLAQFFDEAGIEVNLDTIEGLRKAERAAYFDLSNASLANTINDLIQEMKDPGIKEGLDLLQTQPAVQQAQDDLILVNKFKSLAPLTNVDTAGASRLLQRIVTATAPNDLKAVAELNAFTSAQGLKDRIDDFFSMVVQGQLSEETLREYENTINAIEELSNRQITNAARRLSIFGNDREQKAAQNVLNFYGASTARVVPE